MLTNEQIDLIKEQAKAAYPLEAVWLLTASGLRQVENVSDVPEHHFEVSASELKKTITDPLLAVIHSHCDGYPVPSKNDMEGQILSAVPWGVLAVTAASVTSINWWGLKEIPPLLNRPFLHGISDCLTLVADYQKLRGIVFPVFPREWGAWREIFTVGQGMRILSEVADRVDDPQEGDVIIMQQNKSVHMGIYVGSGLMLHHPGSINPIDLGKLSLITPLASWPTDPQFYRMRQKAATKVVVE